MNWLICGSIPEKDFPLSFDSWTLSQLHETLVLENSKGETLPINRGTSALIASTLVALNMPYLLRELRERLCAQHSSFAPRVVEARSMPTEERNQNVQRNKKLRKAIKSNFDEKNILSSAIFSPSHSAINTHAITARREKKQKKHQNDMALFSDNSSQTPTDSTMRFMLPDPKNGNLHAISERINRDIRVKCLLVGDTGTGEGSRKLYEYLVNHGIAKEYFDGITFHYLFPDVDWHNRVLMTIEAQEELFGKTPLLVADAGFMYVAKMSGYADKYDVFTPDIGEMAFLADEHAPHPFYTRGFLLAKEHDIPELLEHANRHKNISKNLIIKGETDYIVQNGEIVAKITEPSVPSMEAIGGTGDLVTGFLTAQLIQKQSMQAAMLHATKKARYIAQLVNPSPATQIAEILTKTLFME